MKEAALDPHTWIPTAGAAVIGFSGLDEPISDWAREETFLFGSRENASEASDVLKTASEALWITTIILVPGGDDTEGIIMAKLKGVAVEVTSISATSSLTGWLKCISARERPNGRDKRSFPSGHTSGAFVYSSLARGNLDWFEMNAGMRRALQYGLTTVAAGTSWARVEAGAHFPSDVLFGAALGNFLSVFFTRAFLGTEDVCFVTTSLFQSPGAAGLCFHGSF